MRYKLLLLVMFSILSSAYRIKESQSFESIYERTKPRTNIEIDGDYQIESVVKDKVLAPGQKVYENYCATCHAIGLAGAPKTGDAKAWEQRMQQEWELIVSHMVNGYKNMPAMGTCLDCEPSDLEDSLRYILDKSNLTGY